MQAVGWVAASGCRELVEADALAALEAACAGVPAGEGDNSTRAGLAAYRSIKLALQATGSHAEVLLAAASWWCEPCALSCCQVSVLARETAAHVLDWLPTAPMSG